MAHCHDWRGFRTASARRFSRSRSPLNAFEFALENPKQCQANLSRCVVSCLALAELEINTQENVMDKQSKASELNAGIRSTIEQLANETDAARQSELFRNYLKTSAAFYDYSWHNQMLIWKQRPDACFVGGFNTWLKCGRYVRKGEKGIAILAPMFFKDKKANGDDTKRIWFKIVFVFDRLSRDLRPARVCHLNRTTPTLTCRSMRAVTSSLSFRAYRKDDDGVLMDVL
jgi:N-terminal domain of anti-restriction factor ArdC